MPTALTNEPNLSPHDWPVFVDNEDGGKVHALFVPQRPGYDVFDGETIEGMSVEDFEDQFRKVSETAAPQASAQSGGSAWPWYAVMMVYIQAARLAELPIAVGGGRELTVPETGDYWLVRHVHMEESDGHIIRVTFEPSERGKSALSNKAEDLRKQVSVQRREIEICERAIKEGGDQAFQKVRAERIKAAKALLTTLEPDLEAAEGALAEWEETKTKDIPLADVKAGCAAMWW